MSAQREPTVIERMAAARWESMAGLIKPFQSPWNELEEARQKAECSTMLAAVRELRDLLDLEGGNPSLLPGTDANQAYDASNVIERIILDHERRAGGKGE